MTCESAFRPTLGDFCQVVKWNAAVPVSGKSEQARLTEVVREVNELASAGDLNCKETAFAYSCANAFPQCPITGKRQSFWRPCRKVCELVKHHCSSEASAALDCSSLPDDARFCQMALPSAYFELSPSAGPYEPLVPITAAALACWLVASLAMCVQVRRTFAPGESSNHLSRWLASIPATKALLLVLATSFWSTCNAWGYCSFWLSAVWVNFHMIFKTGLLTIMLVASRGHTFVVPRLASTDVRAVMLPAFVFYTSSFFLSMLRATSTAAFWLATLSLLAAVVFVVLTSVRRSRAYVASTTAFLRRAGVANATDVGRRTDKQLQALSGAAMALVVGEMTVHVVLGAVGSPLWTITATHEVFDAIVIGTLMFVFWPSRAVRLPQISPAVELQAMHGASGRGPRMAAVLRARVGPRDAAAASAGALATGAILGRDGHPALYAIVVLPSTPTTSGRQPGKDTWHGRNSGSLGGDTDTEPLIAAPASRAVHSGAYSTSGVVLTATEDGSTDENSEAQSLVTVSNVGPRDGRGRRRRSFARDDTVATE